MSLSHPAITRQPHAVTDRRPAPSTALRAARSALSVRTRVLALAIRSILMGDQTRRDPLERMSITQWADLPTHHPHQ